MFQLHLLLFQRVGILQGDQKVEDQKGFEYIFKNGSYTTFKYF